MARPAGACRAALAEATQLFSARNRASDGILGDAAHCDKPNPTSDHCTGNAFDLTHDPAHGCDAHGLVESLKQRRDPRVKYMISNSRIWNPSKSPDWRPYNGPNPHTKHAHVSVHPSARGDLSPWWGGAPTQTAVPPPGDDWRNHPLVKKGSKGPFVAHMQALLVAAHHDLSQEGGVDGDFGPGAENELKAYQGARGLTPDGVCGPQTWERLHQP